MSRVCIVGAGAIGSLYAAHLARVTDVVVLARREQHARALREHGLHVTGRHDFTASLEATTDPAELGDADLCIIATKATHLDQAVSPTLLPRNWAIVAAGNGEFGLDDRGVGGARPRARADAATSRRDWSRRGRKRCPLSP